ncbi:hypothetical protein HYZ41_00470 [archaeon]|nr:hypothetical protein [archaeon]
MLVATARVAGVDDAIVGTLIGAFTISTAFWASRFIAKRLKRKIYLQEYIISIAFLVMTIWGFFWSGISGTEKEYLYIIGMERLVFGMLLGSVIAAASFEFHKLIRKNNMNKNYFPLQGVVIPLVVMGVADVLLYLLVL